MQSSNPAFTRADGFNGRGAAYPGGAPVGFDEPAYGQAPVQQSYDRMTIDSVVQKSAITLGVVVLAAAATWLATGPMDQMTPQQFQLLLTATVVGSLGAFVLSLVNSFKKVVSPALVIAFAVLEGVFVGAFSKVINAQFGEPGDNLVVQAVLGTVMASAGTLAAYKFFNIQVTDKFRRFVMAAVIGFIGISLVNLVMSLFGSGFGWGGFGGMGLVAASIGLLLGVFMLILDFDFVERGVAAGLPERESWRAAFGLTVTLVWIYINLLRILAILRGD